MQVLCPCSQPSYFMNRSCYRKVAVECVRPHIWPSGIELSQKRIKWPLSVRRPVPQAHPHDEARVGAIAASLQERGKLACALRPFRMSVRARQPRRLHRLRGGARRRFAQVEEAMAGAQPPELGKEHGLAEIEKGRGVQARRDEGGSDGIGPARPAARRWPYRPEFSESTRRSPLSPHRAEIF